METVKLNPAEFVGKQAACKIGNIYSKLSTQASHINKGIEKAENEIVSIVERLHAGAGMYNARIIIDAIYHRVEHESTMADEYGDTGEYFTKDVVREMSGDVYLLGEIAKSLIDLSELTDRVRELNKRAELTKKNVLL